MEPNAHGSLVKERTTAPSANRGSESSHRCLHQKDRHASLEVGRLPSSPRNGLWEPSGNEFQNRENKEHQGRAYVCAWLFSLLLLAEQSSASTAPSCPHLPTALSPAARLRRAPVAAPISTSLASSSVASLPSTAEIGRSQVGIDWFLLFLLEWISFGRGRQGERVPGHHLCIPCWCHSYLTHLRPDSATPPHPYPLKLFEDKKPSIPCPEKFHVQSSLFKRGFKSPRNKYASWFPVCGWHTQAIHF